MYSSCLEIQDLLLHVHLGCLAEERKFVQDVSVNVQIFFKSNPLACKTDNLEDETICYADICGRIQKLVREREFKLIENLCYEIHELIKPLLKNEQKLDVEVIKKNPRVPHLRGGSRFKIFG